MRKMKENACNNKNQKKNPGFLLSAVSSNSGKTAAACGLMSAFKQEGKRVCACKCGPDYIDPMFHREVLGVDSKNLDLVLLGRRHFERGIPKAYEGCGYYYNRRCYGVL